MTVCAMSRRAFLGYGLMAAGCCFVDLIFNVSPVSAYQDYYLRHHNNLMTAFNQTNEGSMLYLSAKHSKSMAQEICNEANRNFRKLLPGLPDVGGNKNLMTEYVSIAAWYVAYYRPFLKQGLTVEELGRMIYDLNSMQLNSQTPADLAKQGQERFSPGYLTEMARWADWTRQRQYPANWVAEFVKGNGQDFDYGYNYSQCALVKYFKAQNALPAAPFVCINDFTRSKAYGTGLERKGTLAMGYPRCDFRYKKGRQVTQGWQSELTKIKRMGS